MSLQLTVSVTRRWFQLAQPGGAGLGTIPALSRDEIPPFCRNKLKATKTARKRADSHHHGLGVLPRVGCTLCWAAFEDAALCQYSSQP